MYDGFPCGSGDEVGSRSPAAGFQASELGLASTTLSLGDCHLTKPRAVTYQQLSQKPLICQNLNDGNGKPDPNWIPATLSRPWWTPFQYLILLNGQTPAKVPPRTILDLEQIVQLGCGRLLGFCLPPPRWNEEDEREGALVGHRIFHRRRPPGALPGEIPVRLLEE